MWNRIKEDNSQIMPSFGLTEGTYYHKMLVVVYAIHCIC